MKTLAAAALSLALVGAALPAFAQTNSMGTDTMSNDTMMNNTTTHHHHHKSNNTHHRHHKMNNSTMMNNSTDTTQNLNQNEMNSTAPAGTAQ